MKMKRKFGCIVLAVALAWMFVACPDPTTTTQTPTPTPTPTTGSITGSAVFTDGTEHGGILITLEATDGLRSASIVRANRGLAAGAQSLGARSFVASTHTAADGSFRLDDVPAGSYVLYASSQDTLEQAVRVGVIVTADEVSNAGTLRLTPVGSISGQILVDDSTAGAMGFIVGVAGTSFMAITDTNGMFTISGVPTGNHFVIIIRGNFTALFAPTAQAVHAGQTTNLGYRNITGDELMESVVTIGPNGNWWVNGVDTGIPAFAGNDCDCAPGAGDGCSCGPAGGGGCDCSAELPPLTGYVHISISGPPVPGVTLWAGINLDACLCSSEAVSFQWNREGIPIAGEINEWYTVREGDLGYAITVTVTVAGNSGSITSDPVVIIGHDHAPDQHVPGLPFFTLHPTSVDYPVGTAAFVPLRAAIRLRDGETESSVSWQWYRAISFTNINIPGFATPIPGATSATFTPIEAGYYFVVATMTRNGQSLSRASHPARISVGGQTTAGGTLAITNNQRQYIRAFGGASNGFWIGDDFGRSFPHMYMQRRDIETMFDPEGPLAFNLMRIKVFPSADTELFGNAGEYITDMRDVARNSIDRVLSGEYRPDWYAMAPSNADFLHFVQRVNYHGGYVVATPYTPPFPGWKMNDDLYGVGTSNLRREFYQAYAEYLRYWAQEMADRGAPIFAISLQNEPTYGPNYYGMLWTSAQQEEFLRLYGHVITGANIPGSGGNPAGTSFGNARNAQGARPGQRMLLQGGTPHNNIAWNDAALNSLAARQHLEIVGYHTYGNWNVRHALSLDNAPRRETWMMEKNVNHGTGPGQYIDSTWNQIWPVMNEIHHVIAHNESSVYTWWYLKRFYSMIGEGAQGTRNGEILSRGWGMGHFSRFLTDTVRVEANLSGISAGIGPGNRGTLDFGVPQSAGLSGIRVLAGVREANPTTPAGRGEGFGGDLDDMLGGLRNREDMVSVLIFDDRTNVPGLSNYIRVSLPPGFTASNAYGILSDPGRRHAPVLVAMEPCGTFATVNLPSNAMVSLRFRGEW